MLLDRVLGQGRAVYLDLDDVVWNAHAMPRGRMVTVPLQSATIGRSSLRARAGSKNGDRPLTIGDDRPLTSGRRVAPATSTARCRASCLPRELLAAPTSGCGVVEGAHLFQIVRDYQPIFLDHAATF